MAGIDISIERLQKLVQTIKPYKTGFGVLIANDAKVVAHHDTTRITKKQTNYLDKHLVKNFNNVLKNNELFEYTQTSRLTKKESNYVAAPLQIGKSTNYWIFLISVPENTILTGVNKMNIIALIAVFFGLVLVSLTAWFLGNEIGTNIKKIHGNIRTDIYD